MQGELIQHRYGQTLEEIFPGTSRMAQAMRGHDWTSTPLGNPCDWPDALKIPLRMLLTSRFEMWLGWGPDLHFFYNDAYIPTLGIKHPVMLGRPFREVWSEVYADVADQVERVRAGEATWNKALLLLLERSGYPEETYHSFSYSPLHQSDGSVGGLLCVVTEETERIIGERRVETLRQLGTALVGATDADAVCDAFRSVFTANRRDFPFALYRTASDGSIPDCAGSEDAVGLLERGWPEPPRGDAPADHIIALSGEADWPRGAWDRPPHEAIAIEVPGPAGQPAMGSLVLGLNPYRSDDAEIVGFARLIAGQLSGAIANIAALDTERRRLRASQDHFRHLVQGVVDYAIYMIDPEGQVSSWNEGARRIKGYEPDEIIGEHFSRFYTPEDRERGEPVRALETARREGRFAAEGWRVRKDGVRFRASVVIDAVRDDDGELIGFAKITRDVTEREEAQRALEAAREALFQSQKMEAIGQLTGGVAHDFNNLLMAILSSLTLLRKRLPDDALMHRLLDNATEGAERGATLTQRMLAFARRQNLTVDRIELPALLSGMGDLAQRSIGPEWPITTNLPMGLPPVNADGNQLEMAILNLVVNARDAMPGGGAIVIAAREDVAAQLPPGRYVRLSVTDRGSGMDAETLRRATEPFFTTKGVGKGTGLGLPMVHGMAQQIGGAFTLESSPGVGTTATLWLPVAAEQARAAAAIAEEEAPAMQRRLRVLAVDDDTLVLINTAALLEDLGHSVVEADSGAEALDRLREDDSIDLIVTDQAMPGMTGLDLLDAAEAIRPGLPAIVASGYGEGVAAPGRQIVRLSKPFSQALLASALADAMGTPGTLGDSPVVP